MTCVANLVALETATTTTTTTPAATTTTAPSGGTVLKGALAPTLGRFNYNGAIGLPGALAACQATFGTTHPLSMCARYADLQSAQAAGDLVGLKDTDDTPVTSFWAIDGSQPALQQCNDDAPRPAPGSTGNTGRRTPLPAVRRCRSTTPRGTLGALQTEPAVQLLRALAWVGCCQ